MGTFKWTGQVAIGPANGSGNTPTLFTGIGSPAGVVSAIAGSLFLSNAGGSGTTLYLKETDNAGAPNTAGWVAYSGTGGGGGSPTITAPAKFDLPVNSLVSLFEDTDGVTKAVPAFAHGIDSTGKANSASALAFNIHSNQLTVALDNTPPTVDNLVFGDMPVLGSTSQGFNFTTGTYLNDQIVSINFLWSGNANSGGPASITNIALTTNVVTVTCANTLVVGTLVQLTGLTTATYLNNQWLYVLTVSGTQFTAAFTHANDATHADTGSVTAPYQFGAPFTHADVAATADPGGINIFPYPAIGFVTAHFTPGATATIQLSGNYTQLDRLGNFNLTTDIGDRAFLASATPNFWGTTGTPGTVVDFNGSTNFLPNQGQNNNNLNDLIQSVGNVLSIVPTSTFPITNVALAGGTLTITCVNTLAAGDIVNFAGLATAKYLNGQQVFVDSATGTQFVSSSISHPDDPSHADTGSVLANFNVTIGFNPGPTSRDWEDIHFEKFELLARKNVASGYAGLDSASHIAFSQLTTNNHVNIDCTVGGTISYIGPPAGTVFLTGTPAAQFTLQYTTGGGGDFGPFIIINNTPEEAIVQGTGAGALIQTSLPASALQAFVFTNATTSILPIAPPISAHIQNGQLQVIPPGSTATGVPGPGAGGKITIGVNTDGATPFALGIQPAQDHPGGTYYISKEDANAIHVNITPGTGTINGAASFALIAQFKFVVLVSMGPSNDWRIFGSN